MTAVDSWETIDNLIDVTDFANRERNPDREHTFTLLQDFTQEKVVSKDPSSTTVLIKEASKLHYYHQNYIYVQNNGHDENYIVQLLYSALMRRSSRPPLASGAKYTPIDLFKHKYVHSTMGGNGSLNRNHDYTIARVWDAEDYRWLFAVDKDGRYTFNIDKGDGLTKSQYDAYLKARKGSVIDVNSRLDWADDDDDNYKYVYEAWRLAHPCKLAGVTQIPNALRKSWARLIDNKGDIAIFRMTASPIEPGHIENRLEIDGIPMTWTEPEIETYFRKYILSTDPNYPQFAHSLSEIPPEKRGKIKESRHLTMLFDPKEHEALFATQLFDYMPISADTNAKIRLRLHCRYGKATGGFTKQDNLPKPVAKEPRAPKKAKVELSETEIDDGWAVASKRGKK